MSSTQVLCLGDIADFINGDRGKNYPSTKDYLSEGIPFFSASDLEGRRVDLSSANFISEDAYNRLGNGKTLEGDILFCLRGSLGKIGLAKGIGRGAIASSLVIVRPKEGFLRDYIYYLLSGPTGKTIAQELDNGSVQGNLSVRELKKVEVNVPPIAIQNGIVNILGTLDDKIELNRKTNETLEGIAKALFKSWFVDFDPVRAKAEGRLTGLPDEISKLFPNSFEESELGVIPAGWRSGDLNDLANLNPESWSAKNHPSELTYVDLSGTKNGKIEETVAYQWSDAPSRARRVLKEGDTIVGTVRPGNRSFSFVQRVGLTGSTGFAVVRPKQLFNSSFLYIASTSNESIDRLAHLADGGAYPAVRPDVVMETPITIPSQPVQILFGEMTDSLFRKVSVNEQESAVLEQLRDALLPRLISGELRVPDAEKMLEEVGI